jgi:hypothetical protein
MKKSVAAVAAAVVALSLASLSGAAFAGDHHGDHGSKQDQKSGSAHQSSTDQQAGVKPSNDTYKDQTCTTGGGQDSSATCSSDTYPGKPDASKQYGNGETAAQIANGKGAPSGTPVYGPGNSQPHKICGRDVHAYKGGDCSKQEEQNQPKSEEQQVTFCDMESSTSGTLETKNASEVASHEFNGSAEENRDIVPPFTLNGKTYSENWDTNGQAIFNAGCNATPPPPPTTTTTSTVKECDESAESTEQGKDDHGKGDDEHRKAGDEHGKSDDDGKKSDDDAAECNTTSTMTATTTTTAATTTTTTAATTTAPTTTAATTTTVGTTTTAPATTTTVAAAASFSSTPPSAASGVLGASKALTAPAAASKASAGVLGTLKMLGTSGTSGTLPFTGLRLWIVELIALGLIGTGVAMRLIARRKPTN